MVRTSAFVNTLFLPCSSTLLAELWWAPYGALTVDALPLAGFAVPCDAGYRVQPVSKSITAVKAPIKTVTPNGSAQKEKIPKSSTPSKANTSRLHTTRQKRSIYRAPG